MRRAILSVGLSAGLVLSACPSLAQPKKQEPLIEVVAKAKPSTRQLELARRYFVAMRFEETIGKAFDGMDPLMMMELEESELSGIDRRALTEATREAMVALSPRIVEEMIPIVAETFTEEELEAIVVFYESPAGQASVTKGVDMMGPMTTVMLGLMPEYVEDLMDRYCAKTVCSPAMRSRMGKQDS